MEWIVVGVYVVIAIIIGVWITWDDLTTYGKLKEDAIVNNLGIGLVWPFIVAVFLPGIPIMICDYLSKKASDYINKKFGV